MVGNVSATCGTGLQLSSCVTCDGMSVLCSRVMRMQLSCIGIVKTVFLFFAFL